MYPQLQEIIQRPAPFEHCTVRELWTDPHTSRKMLDYHLDGSVDIASRQTRFIETATQAIASRFELGQGKRVADFGCGPGLYASRFAATGASVTGIDWSERSLEYARERAAEQGHGIEYLEADYLEVELEHDYDLATLIMYDYGALGPKERQCLVEKFHRFLKPGGALLLDVLSLASYDQRKESTAFSHFPTGGFWSKDPYFEFVRTFKYQAETLVLDKYTLIEEKGCRSIYNWLEYFTVEKLTAELVAGGFSVEEVLGNLAGARFDPRGTEFAVVARRGSTGQGQG